MLYGQGSSTCCPLEGIRGTPVCPPSPAWNAATTAAVTYSNTPTTIPPSLCPSCILPRVLFNPVALALTWGHCVVVSNGPRVMVRQRCAHSCKCSIVPIAADSAKDRLLLVPPGCHTTPIHHEIEVNWGDVCRA
jgi:hypothetical protein